MIRKSFFGSICLVGAVVFSISAHAKDGVLKQTIDLATAPLLKQANEALSLGEPEKAAGMYRKALMSGLSEHSTYNAHNNYCVALNEIGSYLLAKVQCLKAINALSNKWQAHNNLGVAYHNLGLYEQALEA